MNRPSASSSVASSVARASLRHRRSPLVLTGLLALAATVLPAQDGDRSGTDSASEGDRPITHEDIWTLRRLGSPVLAPDGSFAVVPVTEPSYDDDEPARTDLWWVPTTKGAGAPRRLTSTTGGESGIAIRPDGAMLAFTAKREGDDASQLYMLPLDGPGEAQRVTELSTGVSDPAWSADGRHVAFTSAVIPGVGDDEAQAAEAKRRADDGIDATVYEHFPIRSWDHWLDDTRDHLFVVPLDATGMRATAPSRNLLADTDLGTSVGFGGASDPLWAPDGRHILFTCSTNRHEAARAVVPDHVFAVKVGGGEPVRISSDGASWSDPDFSPDGSILYAVRRASTRFVYNLPRLVAMPWDGTRTGEATIVAPGFDRPVTDYVPAKPGHPIYLIATESGRRKVFTIRPGDGTATALRAGARGVHGGLVGNGRVLVSTHEDSATPVELVRIDPQTGETTPLTTFNRDRLTDVATPHFDEFWFESSKGRRIHCWVALPPGLDRSAEAAHPVVVMMHGGPHSSSMDKGHVRWDMRLIAAPGYVVVAPDYTGSVGYGEQFSRDIQGDPLATPCQEIVEATDAAIARYPFIDGSRQAALGASYGGHMANWLQATTTRYETLVGHAGLASLEGQWATSDAIHHRERNLGSPPYAGDPIWQEQSPHTHAADFQTPILLTIGERDYRVPLNQTLHMWTLLKRRDVPSRLIVFHDANHWIMKPADARFFWEQTHGWLARWLGNGTEEAGGG